MKLKPYRSPFREITDAMPPAIREIINGERYVKETSFGTGEPLNMTAQVAWGWSQFYPEKKASWRICRVSLRQGVDVRMEPEFYFIVRFIWDTEVREQRAFIREDYFGGSKDLQKQILTARLKGPPPIQT